MSKAADEARKHRPPDLTVPSYPVPKKAGELVEIEPITESGEVTLSPVPPMLMPEEQAASPKKKGEEKEGEE